MTFYTGAYDIWFSRHYYFSYAIDILQDDIHISAIIII